MFSHKPTMEFLHGLTHPYVFVHNVAGNTFSLTYVPSEGSMYTFNNVKIELKGARRCDFVWPSDAECIQMYYRLGDTEVNLESFFYRSDALRLHSHSDCLQNGNFESSSPVAMAKIGQIGMVFVFALANLLGVPYIELNDLHETEHSQSPMDCSYYRQFGFFRISGADDFLTECRALTPDISNDVLVQIVEAKRAKYIDAWDMMPMQPSLLRPNWQMGSVHQIAGNYARRV